MKLGKKIEEARYSVWVGRVQYIFKEHKDAIKEYAYRLDKGYPNLILEKEGLIIFYIKEGVIQIEGEQK